MNIILNLSSLYDDESWHPEGALEFDLRKLEGCCCYCDKEAEDAIRQALRAQQISGVHWIDTGDYHYISRIWMESIRESFLLALFDNHADDGEDSLGSGLLSCGNWVKSARDTLPYLKGDFRNTSNVPGPLPVYLSIDLDVLSPDWARTDWSQGDMSAGQLLEAVERIAAGHRILGVDICGGLTSAKGAKASDYAINVRTRHILSDYFETHLLL